MPRLKIFECISYQDIRTSIRQGIDFFQDLLPQKKDALIFLKPNLNSHMNSLAGNTTDLRILAACILELQSRGYSNITIGEGTNSGFYRNNISVIDRLRVNALASQLNVKVIDLNYTAGREIVFERGLKAKVSTLCFEADLFINLPKIKTHFEVGITVCLKNLIGCMVGQENKKKVHNSLPRNILNINKALKPHLHIIDGLIAMEGNGPTRGTPVNYGKLIMGENPHLLDYFCSRLMQIPYQQVDYLKLIVQQKVLTPPDKQFADAYPLDGLSRAFIPAHRNLLVRIIFNHKLQRYFQAIRAMKVFDYLCSTRLGGKILYKSGIRQDFFDPHDLVIDSLTHDPQKCSNCGKCVAYCPRGRNLPEGISHHPEQCLKCLYCYLVCPEQAITFRGNTGFFKEQLRQYSEVIKKIV